MQTQKSIKADLTEIIILIQMMSIYELGIGIKTNNMYKYRFQVILKIIKYGLTRI